MWINVTKSGWQWLKMVDSCWKWNYTHLWCCFWYYLSRIENKTLKVENMRLHNIAIQAKNDMKTLRKSQQQQRFVGHSQPVQHESNESLELTPMPTPMPSPSWSEEIIQRPTLFESKNKKCSHCGLSFDNFVHRRKRLKHIRNCKRSGGSKINIDEIWNKLLMLCG